jgi:hypothetical protein
MKVSKSKLFVCFVTQKKASEALLFNQINLRLHQGGKRKHTTYKQSKNTLKTNVVVYG